MSNAFSVSIFDLSIGDNNILRNTLDNPVSMAIDKLLLRLKNFFFENRKKILHFLKFFFEKYHVLLEISSQNFIFYTVSSKIWQFLSKGPPFFAVSTQKY